MSIITLLNKIADRLDELETERHAVKFGICDGDPRIFVTCDLSVVIRAILADPNNDIHGTEL